jgi:hypothetical protein
MAHRMPPTRSNSGHVLPVVLLFILGLAVLTGAQQHVVATEARAAEARQHSLRALLNAESAAAAYVHQWNSGFPAGSPSALPARNDLDQSFPGGSDTASSFRSSWKSFPARYPRLPAPGNQSGEGITVGHRTVPGGIAVVAFGWCQGSVRGVRWLLRPSGLFDVGAAYGVDPYSPDNPGPGNDEGPALSITGTSAIVGRSGAEGRIETRGTGSFYDGPAVLRGPGVSLNPDFTPIAEASSPGDPPGTTTNGTLADPFVRRQRTGAFLPDFDTVLRRRLLTRGASPGLSARFTLMNVNDSPRLVRVLVRVARAGHANLGKTRDLGPAPTLAPAVDPVLDLRPPSSTTLRQMGMRDFEEFAGFRLLPGDHVATDILQDPSGTFPILVRNHDDGETGVGPDGNPWVVMADSAYRIPSRHPDPARASETVVRLWLLPSKNPTTPALRLAAPFRLEKPSVPSDFRIYSALPAGISISGPATFAGTLFALASEPGAANPSPFGKVDIQGIVQWIGSVVAWNLSVGGGAVLREGPHWPMSANDETIVRWVPVDCQVLP